MDTLGGSSRTEEKLSVFIVPISYRNYLCPGVEVRQGDKEISGSYYLVDPFWNGEDQTAPPDYYLVFKLSFDRSNHKESLLKRIVDNQTLEPLQTAKKIGEDLAREEALKTADLENAQLIDLFKEGQQPVKILAPLNRFISNTYRS